MSDSTQFIQFANVVSGETLAYIQQGKGKKNLIFIHGLTHALQVYDELVLPFLDDYLVTRVDFRGHGNSSYNTPTSSSIDIANDIALLC